MGGEFGLWPIYGWALCRGPRSRALGKDFLFFLNILCRRPLARPSAKIFFWSVGREFGPLADLGLGPLPRAQIQGPRQRFFIFFKIFFVEGHWTIPQQRHPLPRARLGPRQRFFIYFLKFSLPRAIGLALGKYFFLVFLTQFFCGAIIHYLKLNFKIWANFDFFLIYFPNLFLFVDFFRIFQI